MTSLKPEDLAELLESLDDVGMPLPTEIRLSALDAIASLSRELEEARSELGEAHKCLDSYATENQQFHDRFTAAEASLTQARDEVARLSERLEITHVWQSTGGGPLKRVPARPGIPDGIECRDETIKLLEASLIQARAERDRYHRRADKFEDAYDRIWRFCRVVFWPGDMGYPIEHAPFAGKHSQQEIERALDKSAALISSPARGIVTEGRDCAAGSGSASARVEPGPEDAP